MRVPLSLLGQHCQLQCSIPGGEHLSNQTWRPRLNECCHLREEWKITQTLTKFLPVLIEWISFLLLQAQPRLRPQLGIRLWPCRLFPTAVHAPQLELEPCDHLLLGADQQEVVWVESAVEWQNGFTVFTLGHKAQQLNSNSIPIKIKYCSTQVYLILMQLRPKMRAHCWGICITIHSPRGLIGVYEVPELVAVGNLFHGHLKPFRKLS